jgi:hypothetical protein
MGESDQKPSGFKVTDRRVFTGAEPGADAAPQPDAPAAQGSQTPSQTPAQGATPEPGAPPPAARSDTAAALPPVDFPTFVLSLGSSALMHLGEVERPQTGKLEKDLGMAKHTIDLLSMLQEKTRGNLTPQEAQLLESLLFDLRLRYVSAAKPGR